MQPVQAFRGISPSQTPLFARDTFIKAQRVTAVAIMALGYLAAALGPATGGTSAVFTLPLLHLGSAVLGMSLIQQVIGDAPGCTRSKAARVFAGALMITLGPVGILFGSLPWYISHLENKYPY